MKIYLAIELYCFGFDLKTRRGWGGGEIVGLIIIRVFMKVSKFVKFEFKKNQNKRKQKMKCTKNWQIMRQTDVKTNSNIHLMFDMNAYFDMKNKKVLF